MKRLRDFTPARVAIGRTGNSLPVRDMLDFQLAHARARDAVHAPFDSAALAARTHGIELNSQAQNRTEYLKRPDLGRKLNHESAACLAPLQSHFDAVFIICDGLSPHAVHQSAAELLDLLTPRLADADWKLAPTVICQQARVAIGDEIGHRLNSSLSVVLIGERPGLSASDSMGVYLTWAPRPGRTDAERNCISNIRPEGLPLEAAAELLWFLLNESRARRLSGVALKPHSSTGAKLASSASRTT